MKQGNLLSIMDNSANAAQCIIGAMATSPLGGSMQKNLAEALRNVNRTMETTLNEWDYQLAFDGSVPGNVRRFSPKEGSGS